MLPTELHKPNREQRIGGVRSAVVPACAPVVEHRFEAAAVGLVLPGDTVALSCTRNGSGLNRGGPIERHR